MGTWCLLGPGHSHARDRLEFGEKSGPSGPHPTHPGWAPRTRSPCPADSPLSGKGTWATRILGTLPPLTGGGDRGTGRVLGLDGGGVGPGRGLSLGLLLAPRSRRVSPGPAGSASARKPERKLFQRPLGAGRRSAPPPPAPRPPGAPSLLPPRSRTPTSLFAQVPYPISTSPTLLPAAPLTFLPRSSPPASPPHLPVSPRPPISPPQFPPPRSSPLPLPSPALAPLTIPTPLPAPSSPPPQCPTPLPGPSVPPPQLLPSPCPRPAS